MPVQAALPEEVTISVERDDRLPTLLGDDADLDLALLNVEDGISRVALREDLLVLPIFRHGPPRGHGVEEDLDVKWLRFPCLGHHFQPYILSEFIF
jgi:hypothetical protein